MRERESQTVFWMAVSKFPVNEFQVFSASDLYMDLITEGGMSDLWPQFLWASTNFKWGLFLYPIHFRSVNVGRPP